MLARKLTAEFIGTACLLIAVVGSGIMVDFLARDIALALLANAVATGVALYVLITIFGPVSGAHFNPAVSLVMAMRGDLPWREFGAFALVQVVGGVLGVWFANLMFGLDVFQIATKDRFYETQLVSEAFATMGLIGVILGGLAFHKNAIPALVGAYITGAYFFTASTSFANPAVTFARMFSDTFAGIGPSGVLPFILVQLAFAPVSLWLFSWLYQQDR